MSVKKLLAAAAVAGSLGATALGIGAGLAQADDHWQPWIPRIDNVVPNNPVAPGQLKKWCPWQSPPGQWIGGPHGVPCT